MAYTPPAPAVDNSFNLAAVTNGVTATAGGAQAGVLITTKIIRVTVVATIGDSVQLPISVPGLKVTLINAGALSLNLFPQTGDAINLLGANVALAVASNKMVDVICTAAGQWNSLTTA